MTYDPRSAEERGIRAQQLLDDPVFAAALDAAREGYVKDWLRASSLEARERAWAMAHALDEVERQLRATVFNGEHAAKPRR